MFKLVVLSCLVSVAFAGVLHAPVHYAAHHEYAQVKTIVEPHVSVVETPTINHVGSVVKNVPTGVSHHSSSVVHSAANIVEPIYAHGVEKKIVSTPVVKSVVEHVPVAYSQPIVKYAEPVYAKAAYVAAPAVQYSAPLSYASAYAPAAHYSSYAAPAAYSAYAAPAAYSAYAPAHYSAPLSYAHHY